LYRDLGDRFDILSYTVASTPSIFNLWITSLSALDGLDALAEASRVNGSGAGVSPVRFHELERFKINL
jgi:hypothetical protein